MIASSRSKMPPMPDQPMPGAPQRFLATKSASQSPRIATFPVSREFVWRRVRSALQPQPTSARFRDISAKISEMPAERALLRVAPQSPYYQLTLLASQIDESLRLFMQLFIPIFRRLFFGDRFDTTDWLAGGPLSCVFAPKH